MSHVTFINESGHIYGWIMSRTRIGDFAYTNESWLIWKYQHKHASCHIHKWVISQIWMSHVTFMDESWHKGEMSHIWLRYVSHVTYVHESCHMYPRVTSHIWISHGTHLNGSCHTYEWELPHKMNVTPHWPGDWLWSGSSLRWLSHVIHIMCMSCHAYECVMAHIWMSHVTQMSESCHTYEWVTSHVLVSNVIHICMGHVKRMNESCHT